MGGLWVASSSCGCLQCASRALQLWQQTRCRQQPAGNDDCCTALSSWCQLSLPSRLFSFPTALCHAEESLPGQHRKDASRLECRDSRQLPQTRRALHSPSLGKQQPESQIMQYLPAAFYGAIACTCQVNSATHVIRSDCRYVMMCDYA